MGAHAVMANGGVIAPVGLNMVALAAKRHAVPFVVLSGVHKVFCCRALSYEWYLTIRQGLMSDYMINRKREEITDCARLCKALA